MSEGIIELDGALGEGGGQILRTSLALSLLTGRPFHLANIRARRPKPGLQPQHLMSVRAAAEIGQAAIQGASKGSQDLVFEPGSVTGGTYTFSIGTAGSTGLVLQTVYLPLALKGKRSSRLTICGGTHVKASPSFHFLDITWRAYLERMGLIVNLELVGTGFYPRGGGTIKATIEPSSGVRPLRLSSCGGEVPLAVTGVALVSGLPDSVAERMAQRATTRLKKQRIPCELSIENWAGSPGAGIALVLHGRPVPTVFFGLGERGKPAERVADEAVDELLAHAAAGACAVDSHSADQILLPLAMAEGPSEYPVSRVTQHLLTNQQVVSHFLDREIRCEGAEGTPGRVVIE
jgi:RNA 3'-terminal phosphate cyclase (ATP)